MNLLHSIFVTMLVVACTVATTARAEVPGDPESHPIDAVADSASVDDLIIHALATNADIRAGVARWQAALKKVPQAAGWPDPKLTYGYFLENVETRVGPQEHRIGVLQPLPWFGKLKAAGDIASENAAAELADLAATRLRVVRDVKNVWLELAWLGEALSTTRENVQLVSQLEGVAQIRFKAGETLGAVTKAQVELGRLSDRLSSLEDMQTPLRSRLNALLNRPMGAPLTVPSLTDANWPDLPAPAQLHAWQKEANPLLGRIAHEIQREEHAVRLARKQGMPEFGVGLDYIVTGEARMPGVRDSGKDAAVAMFSINIPLWRGKYKAMVEEAEFRRAAAETVLENQTRALAASLDMELYQFRDAERKINLYGATLLPQARSALSVAQQNYESGKGDFLDLIDAQRVLLEFELEHQRAVANRGQAIASIEMLVGREMRPAVHEIGSSE